MTAAPDAKRRSRDIVLGRPHLHLRQTGSTNALARMLAEASAPCGTVVTADEQTTGRGRQGRSWFAPPGSALLYSAILRSLGERPLLPLAIPLGVADAVESLAPLACRVKWPNDIWVEERKLAGVLIEANPGGAQPIPGRAAEEMGGVPGWAVIGVGINVSIEDREFPEEIRGRAISIGGGATVEDVLAALNASLPRWIDADPEEILGAFRERDALRGREVAWDGGSGVAAGIDAAGHLLVSAAGGSTIALGAGEVHLAVG